ncbi:heparinase II/III family protein [Desulfosediminicola sp.]|uniref:heparinase II/III family protein n=1 Tax=Desulfosediminicola sp. TaxID=2886825 RepID=UPI003AF2E091
MGIALGLNPVKRLIAPKLDNPFFLLHESPHIELPPRKGWYEYSEAFGIKISRLSERPPNWFIGCNTNQSTRFGSLFWWQIPDFDPSIGDIKVIWEASRFDWVIACTEQMMSGDKDAWQRLEFWLKDWCLNNPPYKGPNWKCGQEASIRVLHLALGARLLGQHSRPSSGLLDLLTTHLQRIAPTLQYALAQDNNHGTSEAAALFIGGSWLAAVGDKRGASWERIGRKWLENRAKRLIASDGSFSQYSVNYHRLLLDTLVMVELWRGTLELPRFSSAFYERARAATHWLYSFVQVSTGDAPNIGANDGARLLPLTDTDYRDYRPSVQLAAAHFLDARAYSGAGDWNLPLQWLGIPVPEKTLPSITSEIFDCGGYAVLHFGSATAVLRYPCFRFRPGQADALHLDLWVNNENYLRDGGTYSYSGDPAEMRYFSGTASHNTVQFDGRDQMPRISRFLFGGWPKARVVEPLNVEPTSHSFSVAYRDHWRCKHQRKVQLSAGFMKVVDNVSGFTDKAVLRWRLKPGEWRIANSTVSCRGFSVKVTSNVEIQRISLVTGWESRYYLTKSEIPVLEIEINHAGELITCVEWEAK